MATQGSVTIDDESLRDRHVSPLANIDPTKLAQRPNLIIPIPIQAWRQVTAMGTLISTPGSSDLGITSGTFGTAPPYITTGDLKAAGATTRRARALLALPGNYEDGQTVTIRVYTGMTATVADTSATVDIEAYRLGKDGTIGSDLCATAAQSINSLSAAAKDFTITPGTLVKGDVLDVRLSVAVTDAATGTAVIGSVFQVELLADTRG